MANKKTIKGLLDHCKKAMVNQVKYIYGAKMKVMTAQEIKALQNIYGKSCIWDSDIGKANHLCCDCSGLISSYTGVARGSSNYEQVAPASVSIAELNKNWNKYIGWALWMKGHIGVVSDTKGYYYAMDGSARNMVHFPMSKQNWTKCIKIKDIDYTAEIPVKEDKTVIIGLTTANVNLRNAPSVTHGKVLTTVKENTKVTVQSIVEPDWYAAEVDGIDGYISSNYVTLAQNGGVGKPAIYRLEKYKVITSPDYWITHYGDIPYLEILIVRSALSITKAKTSNKITDLSEALDVLKSKYIITDKTYWMNKNNQVKYLKELIVSIANALQ